MPRVVSLGLRYGLNLGHGRGLISQPPLPAVEQNIERDYRTGIQPADFFEQAQALQPVARVLEA